MLKSTFYNFTGFASMFIGKKAKLLQNEILGVRNSSMRSRTGSYGPLQILKP
jgi:hypothetical protein